MGAFAIYRQPFATGCTLVVQKDGEVEVLHSFAELNGRSGYVVAPFAISREDPLLLIRPDEVVNIPLVSMDNETTQPLNEERLEELCLGFKETFASCSVSASAVNRMGESQKKERETMRLRYHIDFSSFHAHLQSGEFQKIVLSRCLHEEMPAGISPIGLFQKACEHYPRMFVSLLSTPQSGTWLMATPEILLEGCRGKWRTIALAGTMDIPEQQEKPDWSTKNIQEQRFVATYITECLEQFLIGEDANNSYGHDIEEDGPFTVQAANVLHLRSDFNFTLPENAHIGSLLRRLHPTPAVCGLPKEQTFDFIRRNESAKRHYYSGFSGPLALDGNTHLYVSLRCMLINHDGCHLYAGGGLLRDSDEEQEWEETEAKMEAMKCLLHDEKDISGPKGN